MAGSTVCPSGTLRTSLITPITSNGVGGSGGKWTPGGGAGRARIKFRPSGPIPDVVVVINRPTAPAGKNRLAKLSLTITTGTDAGPSKGTNERPAASVAPS